MDIETADDDWLPDLLRDQEGVVSRAQLSACGRRPHDLKRLLRRRELSTIIPRVFVNHTGSPTWEQRAIAGVLHAGGPDAGLRVVGAALGGQAALRAAVGEGWRRLGAGPIEVCISDRRSLQPIRGYRFVRYAQLDCRVDWMRTPPRLQPAEAALDLVLREADPLNAVGVLADACQSRCLDAHGVMDALSRRARVPDRARWRELLIDLAEGTSSVLEHEFLTRVVRAHGLPTPTRQAVRQLHEAGVRREYRDCEWEEWGLVVELDGRQFHDTAVQRDRDLARDLDDAVAGKSAVRLGWGQASEQACATATKVAALLCARGWPGTATRCPGCA